MLGKEPRRNFSLRDESGRAVPVLGRSMNGQIAAGILQRGFELSQEVEPPENADDKFQDIANHPGTDSQLEVYVGFEEMIGSLSRRSVPESLAL